jgi:hypothetical protein
MLGGDLKKLSLALAHTCRESLGASWGYKVTQLAAEVNYQKAAIEFGEKWNRNPPPKANAVLVK